MDLVQHEEVNLYDEDLLHMYDKRTSEESIVCIQNK